MQEIIVVGADSDGYHGTASGEMRPVQQGSPQSEEAFNDDLRRLAAGGLHRRQSSCARQIQRRMEEFGLPSREMVIDGSTRRVGGFKHLGEGRAFHSLGGEEA